MKYVYLLFLVSTYASAGMQIPNGVAPISNDAFSPYQWALKNQGQVVIRDRTNIDSIQTPGLPGIDLGASNSVSLDLAMKRDTTVAIIDSGADLEHEDLQGAFALNKAECNDAKNPLGTSEDKDHNGIAGDCMGVNFTAKTPNNLPYDDMGHGTHLAGIIAARSNNGTGIAGISQRVKILPLKVLASDNENVSLNTLTDRVIQAVHYAIERKVDIINLSLGWSYQQDTQELRNAFAEAMQKGILIVAAAGNNSISAPIVPCAYEGVICVGAINPQGQISSYSNFGGHVDFLAPGDEILSTYPKKKKSLNFGINGYDYLSGSSQAAAYISGLLGVYRGIYPLANRDELYLRLVSSARMYEQKDTHFTQFGIPSLAKALSSKPNPIVVPSFKNQDKILFSLANRQGQWKLPIHALGGSFAGLDVHIKGQTAATTIDFRQTIANLAAGQSTSLTIPIKVINPEADNEIEVTVEIRAKGQLWQYRQRLLLVRTLDSRDSKRVLKIASDQSGSLGNVVNDKVVTRLQSVSDPQLILGDSEYFVSDTNNNQLKVTLFRPQGSALSPAASFSLSNCEKFLGLFVADLKQNGEADYILYTIQNIAQKRSLQLTLLDKNFKPLLGTNSFWNYSPEVVAINPASFVYIPMNVEGLGHIAVPAQILSGGIPAEDKSKNLLDDPQQGDQKHFYYFNPLVTKDGVTLRARLIDNPAFDKKIRASLNLNWKDSVSPLFSTDNTLWISVGHGFEKLTYALKATEMAAWLSQSFSLNKIEGTDTSLEDSDFLKTFAVGREPISLSAAPVAAQSYGTNRLRWTEISDLNRASEEVLELGLSEDEIQTFLGTYRVDSGLKSYSLTKTSLVEQSVGADGSITNRSQPIARFSYIPAEYINALFYRIYGGFEGASFPAFYVDATNFNSDYVYVIASKGQLSAPASLSIAVPANCTTMNPAFIGPKHQSAITLFCLENAEAEIIQVPIQ